MIQIAGNYVFYSTKLSPGEPELGTAQPQLLMLIIMFFVQLTHRI
jgi:hypothetical protein